MMRDVFYWIADYFLGLGKPGKFLFFVSIILVIVLGVFGGLSIYLMVAGDGEDLAGDALVERQVVEVLGTAVPAPRLTYEANERSRVLSEHQTLIASIPTATPEARLTPETEATREALTVQVFDNGGGLPSEPFPGEDWFDPDEGLYFWRENGGDWTTTEAREVSPYWEYVEYDGYPQGVVNFADGSMELAIARRMAYALVDLRPEFGLPTPAMIAVLQSRLGWEFRADAPDKANVWSYFSMVRENFLEDFRIGGVMEFVLRPLPGDSGDAMYLDAGDFVPPFVVERAARRVRVD